MSNYKELSEAEMSEFDFYVLVDTSGSMGSESTRKPGSTLLEEVHELTDDFIKTAAEVDDDGIYLSFFNSTVTSFDGVTSSNLDEAWNGVTPRGTTNTHLALADALDNAKSSTKRKFFLVITDGAPNDEQKVKDVLINAINGLDRKEEMTFLFIQAGSDSGAAKFLDHLDDDLAAQFDCIDCINSKEAEQMTIGQMVGKALVD